MGGLMTGSIDLIKSAFRKEYVLDLPYLMARFAGRSSRSLYRALDKLGYLSSYTHGGRHYTLREIPTFDSYGLWAFQGIGFSLAGTLRATIVGMVETSDAGFIHGELASLLRVRVQNTVRELAREGRIRREGSRRNFVYLSIDPARAEDQLECRGRRLASEPVVPATGTQGNRPLRRETAIAILVEALHIANLYVDRALVAERLKARGIFVSPEQVEEILSQHGLGKKKSPGLPSHLCKN